MAENRPAASSLLPLSIVIAGALVGLGLFFGLRSRAPEPVASPAVTTPLAISAPASAASPTSAADVAPASAALTVDPPAPTVSAPRPRADLEKIAADATKELEKLRKTVVDACVAPSLKVQPTPSSVKFSFNFSFGADGKQVGRGVIEDRATSRPDVTACMLGKLTPISVPPPGEPVRVDVSWTLP